MNLIVIKKIYNKFFKNYKFSIDIDDVISLLDLIIYLYIDYIKENSLYIYETDFHNNIKNEVIELINAQLIDLKLTDNDTKYLINISEYIVFSNIIPRRSYITNKIIISKKNIKELRIKIEDLKNVYQPEQRTDEWYIFRHNIITASNIWKAFITEKTFEQLVIEKCMPINIDKYNFINEESPMHWGQKYEPVSTQYYEFKYKTIVGEFGCIKHKKLDYLAASPDGIICNEESEYYGRMLEIKNIFNRKINGIPKVEYWIQMQIQMEVCDLNECDFLETRFLEYKNEEEFLNDYYVELDDSKNFKNNIMMTKEYKYKGLIISFFKDNRPYYEYSPFACTYDELKSWESDIMLKNNHLEWFKNMYYYLDEISCVLVLRNKFWFNNSIPIIQDLWSTIQEKKNDKDYLSNNKKKKPEKSKKCLISSNLFSE